MTTPETNDPRPRALVNLLDDLPEDTTAEQFAMISRLRHIFLTTRQGRANRRPQPFAETDADGVKVLGPLVGSDTRCDDRVK